MPEIPKDIDMRIPDESERRSDAPAERSLNFIEQIVEEDIAIGKNGGRVHTRFPPNPTVIYTSVTPNPSV
jgi:glutaminyl-tRNA synthetase